MAEEAAAAEGAGRPEAGGGSLPQRITAAVRGNQGGGRGFGRGRGFGGGGLFPSRNEPGGLAPEGTYTATLKVGDQQYTQTFTVTRSSTAPIW